MLVRSWGGLIEMLRCGERERGCRWTCCVTIKRCYSVNLVTAHTLGSTMAILLLRSSIIAMVFQ